MEQGAGQNSGAILTPWDPERSLRRSSADMARLSKGFLRCRPERWFTGMAAQWLPLAHSLGVELRVVEIQPSIQPIRDIAESFVGLIDDEPAAVIMDGAAVGLIEEALVPGANMPAGRLVLEYIARRLFGSLSLSWSGPESSSVKFDRTIGIDQVREAGAVKIQMLLNNTQCAIYFVVGPQVVQRLDGLWRRQIRSSRRQGDGKVEVSIEVGQLAVAPSELSSYLRSGAQVDMEIQASDLVVLRSGDKPWLPARLCAIDGHFGVEIIPGAAPLPALPDGTTRLAVTIGTFELDALALPEFSQVGVVHDTNIPLSSQVGLVVNGEQLGSATLSTFEGRFAIAVD